MRFHQYMSFDDQSVAARRTESHQWEVLKGPGGGHPKARASSNAGDFIGTQNRCIGPAIDIIRRACERNAAQPVMTE